MIKNTIKYILVIIGVLYAGENNQIQQKKPVHQYIVREAYKLLELQYPGVSNSGLSVSIGNAEVGIGPWETGLVVTGAYREELEDPVYGYGGFNFFGETDGIFVSMTPFWNADLGDKFRRNFLNKNWENNYQKARE